MLQMKVVSVLAAAALGLAVTLGPGASRAADGGIAPTDRHTASAQVIAELLTRYHYRDRGLDDALSAAALESYLDALDPQRYYFLASDIESFERYRTQLDDQLREGRLDAAWAIFRVYRERVRERSEHARELLAGELDLSDDESLQVEREDADWPASTAAMNELWRKRIENDVLSLELADTREEQATATLTERYGQLARNLAQYSADDVFEIYMNAWSELFDPHTNYLSPRTRENFDINMSLSLQGIGAMLKAEGEYTEVTELIPGGPAAKGGELSAGDRIVGVGQGDSEIVSVVGWRLPDVVDLIRGPKGSQVRLEILPGPTSGGSRQVISITRNEIVLQDRAAQSRVIEVKGETAPSRIGIIELPSFYRDFREEDGGEPRSTTSDVAALLTELEADGSLDGLVIDLRGNAGGSLLEATKLTGLFVEDGPVVQVRYSDGERTVLRDKDDHRLAYDGPLTVLVDGLSASASEIFAAAIQDYGRGLVAGHQTFGKGSVQDLIDLNRYQLADSGRAGSLKFTRAKYYRITGGSTQMRGVTPDIELGALLPQTQAITERSEPNALPWDEIDAIGFDRHGGIGGHVERLAERHRQRLVSDPALQALREEMAMVRANNDNDTVSLDRETRRAERERRERERLAALNRRLRALDRDAVSSLDELDRSELPDLVLQETAHITAELSALSAGVALEEPPAPTATAVVRR